MKRNFRVFLFLFYGSIFFWFVVLLVFYNTTHKTCLYTWWLGNKLSVLFTLLKWSVKVCSWITRFGCKIILITRLTKLLKFFDETYFCFLIFNAFILFILTNLIIVSTWSSFFLRDENCLINYLFTWIIIILRLIIVIIILLIILIFNFIWICKKEIVLTLVKASFLVFIIYPEGIT